jgi:hypothetical protein
MAKVYTLGYAQPAAAERLQELMSDQNMLLIDTRKSPVTQFKGWHGDDLKAQWKSRYKWAGRYLGNVNYRGGPIKIADPETGIRGLQMYLSEGHSIVLLCGCKNYAECHRHVIVDLLHQALPSVEIVPESVVDQPSKCGDVVVTVPLSFGLETWIDEGDPVGEEWSGEEWHFYLAGPRPKMTPRDRVYVVYNGAIRGYSPLVRIDTFGSQFGLVRHGDAQAVTIPEYVQGFRGWRYRWWDRSIEVPFPDWQIPDAGLFERPSRSTKKRSTPKKRCDEREIEQGLSNIARAFGISPQRLLSNFD